MTEGGTYGLVYAVSRAITPEVGALGTVELAPGGAVYVGSARGAGGFSRIDRHERVAAGDHDTRHWHVDYLGNHDAVSLVADRRIAGRDVECALAARLADGPRGFGASDCDCRGHLARYPDTATALAALDRAVAAVTDAE